MVLHIYCELNENNWLLFLVIQGESVEQDDRHKWRVYVNRIMKVQGYERVLQIVICKENYLKRIGLPLIS